MTADLVYLAIFLNPNIYPNSYQKKFLLPFRAFQVAYFTNSDPRKNPMLF